MQFEPLGQAHIMVVSLKTKKPPPTTKKKPKEKKTQTKTKPCLGLLATLINLTATLDYYNSQQRVNIHF